MRRCPRLLPPRVLVLLDIEDASAAPWLQMQTPHTYRPQDEHCFWTPFLQSGKSHTRNTDAAAVAEYDDDEDEEEDDDDDDDEDEEEARCCCCGCSSAKGR